jgi:hypothetical protein
MRSKNQLLSSAADKNAGAEVVPSDPAKKFQTESIITSGGGGGNPPSKPPRKRTRPRVNATWSPEDPANARVSITNGITGRPLAFYTRHKPMIRFFTRLGERHFRQAPNRLVSEVRALDDLAWELDCRIDAAKKNGG